MNILLAADGSTFTKKALAFLVTHESLCGPEDELVVFHAQPHLPPRVTAMVGDAIVTDYQKEEAEKVLTPIRTFLDRHPIRYRTEWTVGPSDTKILEAAERLKSHLIVMGTHGHGLIARAVMGSVAQRVITGAHVPVLLVK